MPDGTPSTTVVDAEGLPIEAVDRFINTYLRGTNCSANTIQTYANHLALFFRWLDIRGAQWEQLDFDAFCLFAQDLLDGTLPSLKRVGEYRPVSPRGRSTCEAIIAAVYSFLSYWQMEGQGPVDLRLYREGGISGRSKHTFLAHVSRKRPLPERRLKIRGATSPMPMIISFEDDFGKLLTAATAVRDRTLLSAMYDGGLRISQSLGLHHEDIDIARKRLRIIRRSNNVNGALSKQRNEFTVDMPPRFFELYASSLVDEQLTLGIDSDYVFVNLREGHRHRPMSYSNALQIVQAIGSRAGVPLNPHTLRHTHGTALAKAGWTAPQIAKRLGQSSASSADVYIHLAEDDIAKKYALTSMARAEA